MMPTYKDRKLQVAYKDGVPQVGYRNGEKVLDAPLPESHVITPAFNSSGGNYGLSNQIIGDIQPSRFLGYVFQSLYSSPSSNEGLRISLDNWTNAQQSGYRQTWVVTRLDTYYKAEPFSENSVIGGFKFITTDRSLDMFDANDLDEDISLHIALRCEFDLTLSRVFTGANLDENYVYDDSRGTLIPEFVNDTFKVIEIRTNTVTDLTTIIFSIRNSGLTPVPLDASWKLLVWQYDTNDNLMGKSRLNWLEFTSNQNVFTIDESVFQMGASKFVFQIGQYL